ncbi:hypothetical protein [Paraburkholderia sp. Cpub6]|uniref:hypothetical protein n=1 Tax=Paraburkholderia sp. Cpub6 TaxID=2723094 RepID=UPI00161DDA46|nr:hypothetical protein [Paraburkholderia sp. Cpub6]MBB5462847.1 peptidoglycan hydrolase-like protein with peptidoglycan-binding domain [Paraburkholderia sp. Cpub6]
MLASTFFRGDPALQASLVHDAAHILEGAHGTHVAKIQLALSILDQANIDLSELRARFYGRSTSTAVLAFKQKRKIINYSYQTQADNIVGKMTMATLDQEMLAWEHRRVRSSSYYCGDPVQAGTASRALTIAAGTTPIVLPGNLDILWQPSRGAGRSSGQVLRYLIKAIGLLKPLGINIVSSVASPPDAEFPYDSPVDPDFDPDCQQVRRAAEKMRPGCRGVLRVIACPFPKIANPIFGATKSGLKVDGVVVQPFVLVNTAAFRTDECTFIHEMIHAANLKLLDKDHDPDKKSIFATGNARSVLKPEHAANFNSAFFRR